MGSPIGWIWVAVGLFIIVIFGQTSTLMCERVESDQVRCRLKSGFLGIVFSETEIHHLQSARVEVSKSSDTYRVMLVSNSGNVPLTSHYSGGGQSDKERMAGRINAFIASPNQPSLEIRTTSWFVYIGGAVFVLAGLFIVVGGIAGLKKKLLKNRE